jgi:hypothetical protein
MVIDEPISITVIGKTSSYWRGLGYEFPNPAPKRKFFPVIAVKSSQLTKGCKIEVKCICDKCKSEFTRVFSRNTDCCTQCSYKKIGTLKLGNTYGKAHKGKPNFKVRGENHGKHNPNRTELKLYSSKVRSITRLQNVSSLENFDKPRGICGTDGAYQLDHITSIKKGFLQRISPDVIGNISNLQFIPWKENRTKASH